MSRDLVNETMLVHKIPNLDTQIQPPAMDDFAALSMNRCSMSKCKALLPVGYQYKTCEKCRNSSKLSMQKKRKREKADEGRSPAIAPSSGNLGERGDAEPTLDEHEVSRNVCWLREELLPMKFRKTVFPLSLRTRVPS